MEQQEPKLIDGARLAALRRQAGLSQEGLGQQVDLSKEYVNALERGRKNNPTIQVVKRIADALHVAPVEIVPGLCAHSTTSDAA